MIAEAVPGAAENDDLDVENRVLASNPKFMALFEDARQRVATGEGLSHEEFWRQVGVGNEALVRGPGIA